MIWFSYIHTVLIFSLITVVVTRPLSNAREHKITPASSVLIPPIIKYWAIPSVFSQRNATVKDDLGRPWFCTTSRQSHCTPLFKIPNNFRRKTVSITKNFLSIDQQTSPINVEESTTPLSIDIDVGTKRSGNSGTV